MADEDEERGRLGRIAEALQIREWA